MANPGKKARVFISHGLDDREFASKLSKALGDIFSGRIEVFVPTEDPRVRPVERPAEAIVEAIRSSQLVLVALSAASPKSPWVSFETGSALGAGIPVIPVCLGISPASLPAPLSEFHSADVSSVDGLQNLIDLVADRCGSKPTPVDLTALHATLTHLQLADIPDQELLKRVAEDRDDLAFSALFNRLRPDIVRQARLHSRDSVDAEDIVMDVMLYVWERADVLQSYEPKKLRAYLRFVTRNKTMDVWRRAGKSPSVRAPEASTQQTAPDTLAIEGEERASQLKQVVDALNGLSDLDRRIISLYFFDGLTHREIARSLGSSVSSVRSRSARALSKLRQMFALERET